MDYINYGQLSMCIDMTWDMEVMSSLNLTGASPQHTILIELAKTACGSISFNYKRFRGIHEFIGWNMQPSPGTHTRFTGNWIEMELIFLWGPWICPGPLRL